MKRFNPHASRTDTIVVEPAIPDSRPSARQKSADNSVTFSENKRLNGVELTFPNKPDKTVLDALHDARWRWSPRQQLWYHRDTPEARAFAATLCSGAPIAVPTPPPPTHITRDDLIRAILVAEMNRRPKYTAAPSRCTPDKWALVDKDGIGCGVVMDTREQVEHALHETNQRKTHEFHAELTGMSNERLTAQAEYWCGQKFVVVSEPPAETRQKSNNIPITFSVPKPGTVGTVTISSHQITTAARIVPDAAEILHANPS